MGKPGKQPAMKRTADTEQVSPLYARWERLERARRESSDDLKELFGEAKAFGLNGKALRVVFAEKYRDENEDADKRSKRLETGADVELYRSALARVRESDGESDDQTVDSEQDEIDADDIETMRETARRIDATNAAEKLGETMYTHFEPAPPSQAVVAAVVEAQPLDNAEEGGVRQPSSAPNSVAPTLAADTEGFNPALIAEELSPSSSAPNSQPVDEHDARDDRSPVAADAHATDKTGDRANGGGSDEAVTARPNSTQQAGAGEGETSSAPGHSNIIPITRKDDGRPRSSEGLPRPFGCQHVDTCATTWRAEQPCTLCRKAAGFVEVPVLGEVNAR